MHLRPVNLHVQVQLAANGLDVLETLLVVGAGAAHPDLHVVLDEDGGELAEGADDTLESRGNL